MRRSDGGEQSPLSMATVPRCKLAVTAAAAAVAAAVAAVAAASNAAAV